MSVRALFSSFLLAVVLVTSAAAAPAHARTVVAHKSRKKHRKLKRPVAPVCANTGLQPDAGNLELIRTALDCLHDRVRVQHGLGTLADNAPLDTAAGEHSEDMIARGYFDHDTPGGTTFAERVLAAGYAEPGDGWSLGENLVWADGELATPAALMTAWMNSEGHRENILHGAYRELGLGVRLGTPTGEATGVTVSAEFGART